MRLIALSAAALCACSNTDAQPDASTAVDGTPGIDAAMPADFWDSSGIPAAQQVMVFKFLNRTNGQFADSEVYWQFKNNALGIDELHSIAEQPTYDMPANASGRMYFFVCAANDPDCASDPSKSRYFDFIEHTIGPNQYNGNTTRVDAFGLPIAMRLHCADGFERTVGENYDTFVQGREARFQEFALAAPPEFKALAQAPNAPYRIVAPGGGATNGGFGTGGANAHYYDAFVDQLWAANGLTLPKPGPNGDGLAAQPNLSAAIYRHVGAVAGTFAPDGKLQNTHLWDDPATFYTASPANFYAKFWHDHAIDGKAYGFPYDDVGSYSTYVSHSDPDYMLVAIGW